jgi:hypothetical protein
VALEIDDDRAPAPAAAPGPVVDADDPRRRSLLDRRRPDQAQQRVAADRHGEACGQAGTGLPAHAMREGPLDLGETAGASSSRLGHGRQLLGEDAAWTRLVGAAEAARPDLEGARAPMPGQVGQPPRVMAVHPGGEVPAGRAGG